MQVALKTLRQTGEEALRWRALAKEINLSTQDE